MNFVLVTKEQFFTVIGPLNVTLNLDNPAVSIWEINRTPIGKTLGWALSGNPNNKPFYMLQESKATS